MNPAFESFLARLYVDPNARRRFLTDPRGEAAAAGLTDDEADAAVRIDRVGLELASATFAHKRRHHGTRRPSLLRLWHGLIRRVWMRRAARQLRS
jgi:hypothetical protein